MHTGTTYVNSQTAYFQRTSCRDVDGCSAMEKNATEEDEWERGVGISWIFCREKSGFEWKQVIERRVDKTVAQWDGEGETRTFYIHSRSEMGDMHELVEPLFDIIKRRRRKWWQFHSDLLHSKLAVILMIILVRFVCLFRRVRRNEIRRRKLFEILPQESLERLLTTQVQEKLLIVRLLMRVHKQGRFP